MGDRGKLVSGQEKQLPPTLTRQSYHTSQYSKSSIEQNQDKQSIKKVPKRLSEYFMVVRREV